MAICQRRAPAASWSASSGRNITAGILLTDADLSLQVKYLVEKNKLRNRALHGHGVVCGLKLSCDPHCDGHIILHDGYAIDDCGNDIVVCEKQRYDVIGALRAKRLIWQDRGCDPCEPETTESVNAESRNAST